MPKQFEGVFELFDVTVRRLANGNKLKVTLEIPEDLEVEKRLIEFRGNNVHVQMTQSEQPNNLNDVVNFEGIFEVFDIKVRRLRNGDKLSLTMEQSYSKPNELDLIKLRFDDVNLFIQEIQEELQFEDNEDSDEDFQDVEDPEA